MYSKCTVHQQIFPLALLSDGVREHQRHWVCWIDAYAPRFALLILLILLGHPHELTSKAAPRK